MITPLKATKKDKFRGGEVLPLYFRAHGFRTSSDYYSSGIELSSHDAHGDADTSTSRSAAHD